MPRNPTGNDTVPRKRNGIGKFPRECSVSGTLHKVYSGNGSVTRERTVNATYAQGHRRHCYRAQGITGTGNVIMERTGICTVPRDCSGIGNVPREIAGTGSVCGTRAAPLTSPGITPIKVPCQGTQRQRHYSH